MLVKDFVVISKAVCSHIKQTPNHRWFGDRYIILAPSRAQLHILSPQNYIQSCAINTRQWKMGGEVTPWPHLSTDWPSSSEEFLLHLALIEKAMSFPAKFWLRRVCFLHYNVTLPCLALIANRPWIMSRAGHANWITVRTGWGVSETNWQESCSWWPFSYST